MVRSAHTLIRDHDHVELAVYVNSEVHKKNINKKNKDLDLLINAAARTGCIDCCATLVGAGAITNNEFYIDQMKVYSPLFVAAGSDHLDCFKWLVERGFSIDPLPFTPENTLFTYAIHRGATKVFDYLLDKVDVNYSSPMGYPPLTIAIVRSPNPLYFAEKLIKCGANVNGADSNGEILYTDHRKNMRWHVPITGAVAKSDQELINLLLDNGADIYQKGLECDVFEVAQILENDKTIKFLKKFKKGN